MIYTDGVRVASDTSLAELSDFAQRVGLAKHQLRINRWAIYYEIRDATQAQLVKRAGAQHVATRNAVWAKWANRPGAPAQKQPPPEAAR